VIAPALATLAGTMIWMGELGEGERWLQRAMRATQSGIERGIRLLLHLIAGMVQAGRGRHRRRLRNSALPGAYKRSWLASMHWQPR
jgi:LuxR family maltose regulon positive regulatory protein